MEYYIILDIAQAELAEYTGVKKHALGFPAGLVKGSHQVFAIENDKKIHFKAPEEAFTIYAVYFDSTGIRFGKELHIEAGHDDLNLKLETKMGLSSNILKLSEA